MAFSFGLPFFMLMKVLTPAFFARQDTKTPMYIALISLILNAILNYLLAFTFGLGHVGIALGSCIAALISVIILEILLFRDGFIEANHLINRFNLSIFFSSIVLIVFLYNFTNSVNFISLSQPERLIYLSIEVISAIIIYFFVARLIFGKSLRTEFN